MSDWTTPKTDWSTGELVADTHMNDIGNNLNYLRERAVGARVTNTSNLPIPDTGAATPIEFNSSRFDTDNMRDTVNVSHLKINTPGKYLIVGQVAWEGDQDGWRELSIQYTVSGNTKVIGIARVTAPNSSGFGQCVTTVWDFTASDVANNVYVELTAALDNSGASDVDVEAGDYSPDLMAMLLSETPSS